MGLLISSYYKEPSTDLTFEGFKNHFLKNDSPFEAKKCFDGLRRLQKRFEDAFNDPTVHNMIGAILRILDKSNRDQFVKYFFVDDNRNNLESYYKKIFLGLTHKEIISNDKDKLKEKYDATYSAISNDFAYIDYSEDLFRVLLRLNIDQDILQKRKFNFDIWLPGNRSIEHIYPKSLVIHSSEGKFFNGNGEEVELIDDYWYYVSNSKILAKKYETISREDITSSSEHGIGNLVLLYKNENSVFNKNDFKTKKKMFFSPLNNNLFKSRHLLHTICVFAEELDWNAQTIAKNKENTINQFEDYYKDLIK